VNSAWAAVLATALAACAPRTAPARPDSRALSPLPVRPVRVVAVHPHDPRAFTQGLVFHAGRLFESLGLEGRSALREVELASGRVLREVRLSPEEFGEGLALVGDRLVQLTWRNGVAHRWRITDLTPAGAHRYAGEGWGLAYDGRRLIQSDGSATLTFRAPEDFSVLGTLGVRRDGRPEPYLNELELADGALYANLWQSDEIVRIELASGEVRAVWSAAGLLSEAERAGTDVLNGIAWNPGARRFYLTGKLWPKLFEVELPLD
jgi:glutamine cyclotransferase